MTDIEHPHRTLNPYLFAPLGAVSGALYALVQFGLFNPDGEVGGLLKWVGAGLFYGVIVGFFLRRELDWHLWKLPAFIVAAGVSYLAAFELTIKLASNGPTSDLQMAGIGALAGGLGALLLDLAVAALSRRGRHLKFLVPTALIGAVLGAPIGKVVESESVVVWVAFFAIWQGAYAGWSAMTLSRRVIDTQ
ncbi:MAG: hypothetical protein ABI439_11315 [Rhodospirillales bacterium]